jgi:hypothetical protein
MNAQPARYNSHSAQEAPTGQVHLILFIHHAKAQRREVRLLLCELRDLCGLFGFAP